jgi:hypothetical protein
VHASFLIAKFRRIMHFFALCKFGDILVKMTWKL